MITLIRITSQHRDLNEPCEYNITKASIVHLWPKNVFQFNLMKFTYRNLGDIVIYRQCIDAVIFLPSLCGAGLSSCRSTPISGRNLLAKL